MGLKEYLLSQDKLQLSAIARKMWPNNKSAPGYLSSKLNDTSERPFSEADEKKAVDAIAEICGEIAADIRKYTR